MTTTRALRRLLAAGLLLASGIAGAADPTITVAAQDGKTVAQFTIGDSNCVLKDDQIRCTRVAN